MYARCFSSKYVMSEAKTIDDMVVVFKAAAQELEAMRDDGVELCFDTCVSHGNAMLVTDDADTAEQYGFFMEDHLQSTDPAVMAPSHPGWEDFYAMLIESIGEAEMMDRDFICCHITLLSTVEALESMVGIDVRSSLEFFYANGARCDCEVLDYIDPDCRFVRRRVKSVEAVMAALEDSPSV
jgi:hypothetical protein